MNKPSVTPFHRLTAWVTLLAFIFTSLPAHATLSTARGRIIFNRGNGCDTVPLAGIPVTVTRTYDSRDKCPGDFGTGWNLDIINPATKRVAPRS